MAGVIAGIDIGTSGCRVLVADLQLKQIRLVNAGYKTSYPEQGMAVQDPDEIFGALAGCLKKGLDGLGPLEGIVVGCCFHTLLLTDGNIKPLDGLIPWLDTRATGQARRIYRDGVHTYELTACPPSSSYPLAKLIWYRENFPEILQKARVVGIKEYILYKLTGKLVVDQCVACGTGLFDVHTLNWDDSSLDLAGVNRNQLADVVPCIEIIPLSGEAASLIGVPAGTPVIAGGGDGIMASLGVGAKNDDIAVMIGTSAACRKLVDKPILDQTGKCRTWCYYFTDNIWAVGTSVNNGGIVYKWFIEQLCGDLTDRTSNGREFFQLYLQELRELSSKGIVFLPFIRPEREPFWDPDLSAEYSGINSQHSVTDLLQATILGVSNLVYTMVSMVEEVAGSTTRILATGGFARLEPWVKDLANLFGRSLYLPENREAAAYGACILGLKALNRLDRFSAAPPVESRVVQADMAAACSRREEYNRFREYLVTKMAQGKEVS